MLDGAVKATGEIEPFDAPFAIDRAHEPQARIAVFCLLLANFLRIVELIGEFGPDLGRPHTAPLGQGLFEIRAKGTARSVFCTVKGQEQ